LSARNEEKLNEVVRDLFTLSRANEINFTLIDKSSLIFFSCKIDCIKDYNLFVVIDKSVVRLKICQTTQS